jgi:hypothetical protein
LPPAVENACCRLCTRDSGAAAGAPYTMLAHDPFDPLAADGLALSAQFGIDARCAVSFPVLRMDPPDVDQQRAIGDLAGAVGRDRHA